MSQNYLGIKLVKKDVAGQMKEFEKKIDFDPVTTKALTISDLKEMKEKALLLAKPRAAQEAAEMIMRFLR